jgi:hypothetical protein
MTYSTMLSTRNKLIDDAIAETGLDDFGSPSFLRNMERHLMSIDACGMLTRAGTKASDGQIGAFLRTLLHAQAGLKARPDVLHLPITKPLIITGIPRSGTTALHRLLSVDPQFQGLEHWLTRTPTPRPPREIWTRLPAYRDAKAKVDAIIAKAPEMLTEHMFSVDGVEETIWLLAATFCSNFFPEQWTSPSYDAWYHHVDERPIYLWMADVLRLIGADSSDKRWLMKNNSDLFSIDALLAAFPDAMIVQTHRDPVQAIPSTINLMYPIHRIYEEGKADPEAIARREIHFWKIALDRMETAKAQKRARYLDVDFRDFVSDQMGTVQKIYEDFDIPLKAEVEAEMRLWLAEHPRRAGEMQRHKAESYGTPSPFWRNSIKIIASVMGTPSRSRST